MESRTATGEALLNDPLLDRLDTLIVISLDTKRTDRTVTSAEVESLRRFLARADTMLFVCPHHDIGDTDGLPGAQALERQTAGYHHHGDVALPGQQRTGGFALSLMARLGAPIGNRFGLRPATTEDGNPAPIRLEPGDWQQPLRDVPYLNLHPHLPHFERLRPAQAALEVLVRQVVSLDAPRHPILPPGSLFDSVLQGRPDAGLGRLTVCDATLWTSNNARLDGLEAFWKNTLMAA
jgi:hypothetical protein